MADLIDHMTSRFLQWKLPDDFSPDGGVTFTAVSPHGPVGTNLLTYTQAKAMVEYMIDGAPLAALEPASGGVEAHPYSLRPDLQRIVDNAKTAPQWDTERDCLAPATVDALVKAAKDVILERGMPGYSSESDLLWVQRHLRAALAAYHGKKK